MTPSATSYFKMQPAGGKVKSGTPTVLSCSPLAPFLRDGAWPKKHPSPPNGLRSPTRQVLIRRLEDPWPFGQAHDGHAVAALLGEPQHLRAEPRRKRGGKRRRRRSEKP